MKNNFYLPLMADNIERDDVESLIDFLSQTPLPKLTNGPKVEEFEKEWSKWLGVKYSVMVNSGASANELTMLSLKYLYGDGEIIIPPLTWISDVSSVLFAGLTPVFVDVNLTNLSFDTEKLKLAINQNTKAIFLTHVLGINGLSDEILELCKQNNIKLIEDVCESHGTTFKNKKVGSFGFASNFSFYFAHHMSTIEGGVICTDDYEFYQICRALRSHGMMREMTDGEMKQTIIKQNSDLNPDFIFIHPSHNFRSTEINAVIGLNQLKKLDNNNKLRITNFDYFIKRLNSDKYVTELNIDGQCNYAFIVIMKSNSFEARDRIEKTLKENKIEFRRGLSGGGNQMRQPFMKQFGYDLTQYPNVEHIHNFAWYIGNYPSLQLEKIDFLIKILNSVEV